jgi:hypothetical protein
MIKNLIKLVYRIDKSVLGAKLEKTAKKVNSFKWKWWKKLPISDVQVHREDLTIQLLTIIILIST